MEENGGKFGVGIVCVSDGVVAAECGCLMFLLPADGPEYMSCKMDCVCVVCMCALIKYKKFAYNLISY